MSLAPRANAAVVVVLALAVTVPTACYRKPAPGAAGEADTETANTTATTTDPAATGGNDDAADDSPGLDDSSDTCPPAVFNEAMFGAACFS